MTTHSINTSSKGMVRDVMALAVPSVIANITTPLLSMADVAIMGRMGSAVYIAAIAVGGTMFNLLYWLLGFLRMGSSGLTAQAYGAGDTKESSAVLTRAMLIAFTFGALFIILRAPLCHLLLTLMDPDGATVSMATTYFEVCIWGAPAALGMFVFNGWFLGMQSSKIPMWISVFINIVNIAVSITLVFGMDMGIRGCATGTLTAQWAGFTVGAIICLRRFTPQWPGLRCVAARDKISKFFRVNSDIFLRTVCLVAVTVWFTRTGASQGSVVLAANALLMQFFTLFSYFMDGFAFAAEALCGRFFGSGDHARLLKAVKAVMKCGVILAAAFTIIYFLCGQQLIHFLSDDEGVRLSSREYFWWAVTIPLAGFTAFAWDGVAIGTSRTRLMLLSMAWASVAFFAILAVAYHFMGNHGLWLAFTSYLLVRGLVLTCYRHRLTTLPPPDATTSRHPNHSVKV